MFSRPTLTQLRDQAVSDILIGTGLPALLRRSPLRALAYAVAGLAQGLYGYLDWIARQANPFTATGVFLVAWAALVGIMRLAATTAAGTVTLSGTGLVAAGSILRRSDGTQYATTADITLAGTGMVAVVASVAGSAGTLTVGSTLTLLSPVLNVNSSATVATASAGTDQELDAALRTRMLQRWAAPPQGGAQTDYIEWALAVPGVTRAWINPLGMGAGTVVVYTMWDLAETASNGFPVGTNGVAAAETRDTAATGDQLTVANAIYPLRPVTALVYSVSPIAYPVAFTIHLSSAISAATQTAVAAAIDGAFLAYSTPLDAEIDLSVFEAAIANVPGMPPFTVTAPCAPIVAPLGYLPMRGTVTYA